ncbi:hypothetical protein KIN20_005981 [Parelaphostrongylus tenuis]|uniref:Uncharacterized protein n=1 Tax=Parelaphostrongylus tenuis TaxID=148309 RepID=A0AAD5MMB0_PARTN|nr:hypothetical protein KIN20_005981 [Parelaphostrongylus tenuis]
MSGTWSRKRRNIPIQTVVDSSNYGSASHHHTKTLPLPTCLQHQQVLLSRSSEKMLEESELSGVLNLTGRKMKEFPSNMAAKYDMSDLVSIDLSDNRLTEIPTCICESRSLESVRLRGNALRSIPSNIVFLHSLTVLDLSNNKIVHLPLGLFELPLEIILLTGNRLESIPREIRQLSTTLAELDVSCNLLKTVPADIALLKMLRVLNLRNNLLEQFPSELCRLSLHTLDLSSNRFVQLPVHIRKMKSLVELRVGNNPLQSPPACLIDKGREYLFKWMDIESSGGEISSYGTLHSAHNTSAFKSAYCLRGAGVGGMYEIRHCSMVDEKRHQRATRFNTVGGSDSGYASTADDHRLSHELAPSSGLDEITEYAAFPPRIDDLKQGSEKSNRAHLPTDEDSCGNACSNLYKPGVNSDIGRIATGLGEKFVNTDIIINEVSPLTVSNLFLDSIQNGNEDQHHNKTERLTSLDLSNNNSSVVDDAYGASDDRSVIVRIATMPSKPISKVAPLVSVQTKSPLSSTQNITTKAAKSKICPPSTTDSMRKICRNPPSRNTKSAAHNSSPPKMISSCSTTRSSSLKKPRLPPQATRPSNVVTGVPKTAARVSDNQHQKTAKPSALKNEKTEKCKFKSKRGSIEKP